MNTKRVFKTIDSHTVGMPTRTVVSGIISIPGKTMEEKMIYMRDNMDWVRTFLLGEPRGSKVMSGAIITAPVSPEADVGVLFMEGSWMPMCGHDTIGVCTALVETGMVTVTEPYTQIILDTAAGLVKTQVRVENGRAKEVSFVNVPSFLLKKDVKVQTEKYGELTMDIAYGGNFYAILPAADVGLTIDFHHYSELIEASNVIRDALAKQVSIEHPEKPFINRVNHIEFIGPAEDKRCYNRNVIGMLPGDCGRSPCGTGTSARSAQLYSRGLLQQGEEFWHESMLGQHFKCKIVGETTGAGLPAVIPQITGTAYIMGMSTFFLDPDDPFPNGFSFVQQ